MANELQVDYTEWTPAQLRELGCGAFYAVTQANGPEALRTDRLIRLKYTPSSSSSSTGEISTYWTPTDTNQRDNNKVEEATDEESQTLEQLLSNRRTGLRMNSQQKQKQLQKPLILVGKGVCYDTGGINLKTANSMKTMKHDMGGSAAALGTFFSLIRSNYSRPTECWLAVVENNIDRRAYRPDDVVVSVTGESIEIVHSDAEGRLLLADVLAIASRKAEVPSINSFTSEYPALVIDFATLTGTCISSLSNRYIGAFTNREEYLTTLMKCGEECGERVWPFPMDDDFSGDLHSDVADVLQCRQPTEADHIYAAIFLKRFVHSTVPWVHLDLGSNHRSGGLGHVSSDFTGSGVRVAASIIRNLLSRNEDSADG